MNAKPRPKPETKEKKVRNSCIKSFYTNSCPRKKAIPSFYSMKNTSAAIPPATAASSTRPTFSPLAAPGCISDGSVGIRVGAGVGSGSAVTGATTTVISVVVEGSPSGPVTVFVILEVYEVVPLGVGVGEEVEVDSRVVDVELGVVLVEVVLVLVPVVESSGVVEVVRVLDVVGNTAVVELGRVEVVKVVLFD